MGTGCDLVQGLLTTIRKPTGVVKVRLTWSGAELLNVGKRWMLVHVNYNIENECFDHRPYEIKHYYCLTFKSTLTKCSINKNLRDLVKNVAWLFVQSHAPQYFHSPEKAVRAFIISCEAKREGCTVHSSSCVHLNYTFKFKV